MKSLVKILILEDDLNEAKIIQRLLNKSNFTYEFTVASNRDTYLQAINDFQPHVILSDNSLPHFNGADALQIAKERLPQIPFILVTGTVSEEFAVNIIKAGADDYFLKDRLARLPVAIEMALKKKQIEKEKQYVEERNRLKADLLNTIGQAVWATDLKGTIIYWNKAAEQIYGWSPEEAIGKEAAKVIPSEQASEQSKLITDALKGGLSWSGEFVTSRKNGMPFPVYANYAPIYDQQHQKMGVISISNDITERKKTEEELKKLNGQLRNFSTYLQDVREEERKKIAQDIHDELGQQLTGLKMEISWWIKKHSLQDKVLREKGTDIIKLIDEAVLAGRRISANLHPSILEDLGLVAALQWYSTEVKRRTGTTVHFETTIDELKLPLAKSTGVFRIYQDLISNAVHYSNADRVISSLEINERSLILKIQDNGQYTDIGLQSEKNGLEQLEIKERIFILGGQYKYCNNKSESSEIIITIPF